MPASLYDNAHPLPWRNTDVRAICKHNLFSFQSNLLLGSLQNSETEIKWNFPPWNNDCLDSMLSPQIQITFKIILWVTELDKFYTYEYVLVFIEVNLRTTFQPSLLQGEKLLCYNALKIHLGYTNTYNLWSHNLLFNFTKQNEQDSYTWLWSWWHEACLIPAVALISIENYK